MEEKTSVILHDRQLVGANGGLTVFYQLRSYTLSVDLSHNDLFGPDGLKVLLEGLVDLNDVNGKGKGSESKLRSLKLTDCGLGFADGDDRSLDLLALYLPHLPDLRTLDLTNNSLTLLPPGFTTSLLTHPTLSTLILSANDLGRPPPNSPPSSPPAIHFLLNALLSRPSTSTSSLKSLHLNLTSLSSLTSPLLLQLLQPHHGILDLRLNANALAPLKDLSPLVDTLRGPKGNRFLQNLEIYGCFDEDDLFQSTEKSKELVEELAPYLARNRRLLEGTREAAREVVRLGRVVMLASSRREELSGRGEEREEDVTTRRATTFPILELPTELMQPIFSQLYPGALSQKQVARLLGWVGERGSLGKGLDAEGVLKEVGCWWWEGGS